MFWNNLKVHPRYNQELTSGITWNHNASNRKKETHTRGKKQSKELEKTSVKYTWQKISIKDVLRAIKLKQQPPPQFSSKLKEIMNWTKNARRKNCRMPVNTLKSVQLFFIEEQIKTLCDFLASQVEELSPWKHKTTNTVRVWRKGNSYLLLVVI